MKSELVEIFINTPNKDYDVKSTLDRIESAIDRDDVHGVMLPFDEGISVFIESMEESIEIDEYKKFITERLVAEFGDEINEIEFIFEGE